MDQPIAPKPEEFGLTIEKARRLWRVWLPTLSGNRSSVAPCLALDDQTNVSLVVRTVHPGRLAAAAGIGGVLYGVVWALAGGLSLWNAIRGFFSGVLYLGPLAALASVIARGIVIRPLYVAAARILVPGFGAFARLVRACEQYAAKRAEYDSWRLRLAAEFWKSLSGTDFEREVAGLYRRAGYQVTLTPGSSDGGIDIVIRRGSEVTAVQCKALRRKVGVSVGRELVTAASDIGATKMMIACTAGASPQLLAYAGERGIDIMTAEDLVSMQSALDGMPAVRIPVERTSAVAQSARVQPRSNPQRRQ